MKIRKTGVWAAGLLMASGALASGAHAQNKPEVCVAHVAAVAELTPWNAPVAMQAAASDAQTSGSVLPIGKAARLTLKKTSDVRYPHRPGKPGDAASFGGLLRIDVKAAGTYRVALGSAGWIDLVRAGKPVASAAHAHGPACTGIRKMVDFSLTPGRYTLQIAAGDTEQTAVLVAALR